MNTEMAMEPNLVQKIKRKRSKPKLKKTSSKRFDYEGFLVTWGIAIFFAVIGIKIIWTIKKTPEVDFETNISLASRHLVGFYPETFKEILIFVVGSLFIIGSVFCIFLGLKIVAYYIVGKRLKLGKTIKSVFFINKLRKLFSDKTSISE